MSIKLFSTIFTCLLIVTLIVAIFFHLSLWFLWHLLPEGNLKFAVNSSQPGSQVITELLDISPLEKDTIKLLNNAKRYSYSQANGFSSIALVPSNPFLFKDRNLLISYLKNNNWHITNLGLVIIGTNNTSTSLSNSEALTSSLPPLKNTVINTFSKLFSPQHPYKPTIIAKSNDGSLPLLSEDTALVGVIGNKNKELKIIIAPDLNNFPNFSISGPALPEQANHLAINIPGTAIKSISSQFSNEWNEILYNKLNFSSTKPPIINYMGTQQTSSITITNEKIALAIIGDPTSLKDTFHQWMQEEEAYSRPQKRAFKLPDGTLGYELIKGDLKPMLSASDILGCFAPTSETINLWLCQNDKGISLATNQAAAKQELSSISSSVQTITLGSDFLQQLDFLPVKNFQALAFYSSGEYTILTIKLKQD